MQAKHEHNITVASNCQSILCSALYKTTLMSNSTVSMLFKLTFPWADIVEYEG
jgi:hypothetical protein